MAQADGDSEQSIDHGRILMAWASEASDALRQYFDLSMAYFQMTGNGYDGVKWICHQLAVSCHLTSESVLLLVSMSRIWDSEVMIRSVTEGTVRFLYLTEGTHEEQAQRAREYEHDMPQITRVKRHDRITTVLKLLESLPDRDEWGAFKAILLPDAEVDSIRAAYPKKQRQQLDHRWSFNELLLKLAKQSQKHPGLQCLPGLSYGYGMSSHLIHQDADAVSMIWERSRRNQTRRIAIELAHGARILSDALTMAYLRAIFTCHLFESNRAEVTAVYQATVSLRDAWKVAHDRWWVMETEHEERRPEAH